MEFVKLLKNKQPDIEGRSKKLWKYGKRQCVVELKPTLRSFTYNRDEELSGIEVLRLDFFEKICLKLADARIRTSFLERIDSNTYLSTFCEAPPIEVILKNFAVGSTQKLYKGLFNENFKFPFPIVKFDYRIDPEDLPLPDDYVDALGLPSKYFREVAHSVNSVISAELIAYELVDFCLIFGIDGEGNWQIISEISPDAMRIRDKTGLSYDKDLFRNREHSEILLERWKKLADSIAL